MKRELSALVITAFLTTSTFGTAMAAEADSLKVAAGVTPDSIIYSVERAVEDIQLVLTRDDVEKAELLTQNAQERLAETQAMDDDNKVELAQKAAEDYTETIEKANEQIQNMVDNDEDDEEDSQNSEVTTDTTVDDGNVINEKLAELLEKNVELQKKSVDVLAALLEKLPEESRQAITAVIVKQVVHTEAVRNFVEAKKAYNDGTKAIKEAEKALRDAQKSGEQEKISEAEAALDQAKAVLEGLAETKSQAWKAKKDVKSLIEQTLAEINNSDDETGTETVVQEETQVQDGEEIQKQNNKIRQKVKEIESKVEKELNINVKQEDKKKDIEEEKKNEVQQKVEDEKNQVQTQKGNVQVKGKGAEHKSAEKKGNN